MTDPTTLAWMLRATGVSLIILGGLHAAFWRFLRWGEESKRLSPLNARVFVAHVYFVAFVLVALGLLMVARPELLIERSDLARFLLYGLIVFCTVRLLAQSLVFDPVLAQGWRWRNELRVIANLLWLLYVMVFALALSHQLQGAGSGLVVLARFDFGSYPTWARVGVASVWLTFGLVFKALNVVPRHRQIVARILGNKLAGPATLLIAITECAIGVWMLIGVWIRACVAIQTAAIVSMNALEIRYARDLLLSPRLMILANLLLLCIGWYAAIAT